MVHFGSGGKLHDSGKFVHFGVVGIRSLHCSMCVTSEIDTLLLQPRSGARVRVNRHCVSDSALKVSVGDCISFAQNILFVVCSVGKSTGYIQRCWDVAENILSQEVLEKYSVFFLANILAWQKDRIQRLLFALSKIVCEANQISNELSKDVNFDVRLYSDLSETRVCVLVTSSSYEVDDTWDAIRMCHQLAQIRRLRVKHLPDFISTSFFFEPTDHHLIGVGFCYLEPILYMMNLSVNVPIVDFKGNSNGDIRIEIESIVDEHNLNEEMYTPKEICLNDYMGHTLGLDIQIQSISDLPRKLSSSVYVCTSFFLQRAQLSTARCEKTTTNPQFRCGFSLRQAITGDLLAYLATGALELQVFGRPAGI